MARVNRGIPRRQQRDHRRLRPGQMEGRLEIALGRHTGKILVPAFAKIQPEFGFGVPGQHIPGAFDVGRGERLAVVPLHALAQVEGDLQTILAHRPGRRQVGLQLHVEVVLDQAAENLAGHDLDLLRGIDGRVQLRRLGRQRDGQCATAHRRLGRSHRREQRKNSGKKDCGE